MRTDIIAGRIATSVLAGRANPVTDPEIIKALKREGFKLKRGFWTKEFDQGELGTGIWRAEMTWTGDLMFRSRWSDRPHWGGGIRPTEWPKSLAKFAARGNQTKRKDKDLMRDTGGTSKGRDREPHLKPPRDDVKERYRDQRKRPDQKDTDTKEDNKDREVKKPGRRPQVKKSSEVHPLDRKNKEQWLGMDIPEDNYHSRVKSALHHIMETEQHISEKDFSGQDALIAETDRVVRLLAAEGIIQRFERGAHRPSYCAECLFASLMTLEGATTASKSTTVTVEFEDGAEDEMGRIFDELMSAVRKVGRKHGVKFDMKWRPF
jgi:hypothetical protein